MDRFIVYVLLFLVIPSVLADTWITECAGCHTQSRHESSGSFPNGSKKWTDANCFGCHDEITEVAMNHNRGILDSRYYTLPIKEDRIKRIDERPFPYVKTPINPLRDTFGNVRVNSHTLLNFLARPHGKCNALGKCLAPYMMAYPNISNDDFKVISNLFKLEGERPITNTSISPVSAIRGETVFSQRCKSCHLDSNLSEYNGVGLSLFSRSWIYRYTNGHSGTNNATVRKMPIMGITLAESEDLYSYFQSLRKGKEESLDSAVSEMMNNNTNLHSKQTSIAVTRYLWSSFWRDTGCVHCHSIEGRAKSVFETSIPGIKRWFAENDPRELTQRLRIRHLEDDYGIGAKLPGMPMTGAPLPSSLIDVVESWIHTGCQDEQGELFCSL